MPSSPLYHHAFTWEGNAEQVVVTGSFDNWSSSLPLHRIDGTDRWEAETTLKWGEKVVYKFVVDSQWRTSPHAPTERDWNGNENNVLSVPNLALPPVTQETLDNLAAQVDALGEEEKAWRTVRLTRWTGTSFSLFAALPPSPSLTFQTLRHALLPSLVEGGAEALPRSFAFARLGSSADEGLEIVDETAAEEKEVGEGTYVLVGADAVLPLRLKHFPLPAPPQASASSSLVAEELDVPTPPSALLTPSSLSRIPRSTTRYFDFSENSFSSEEDGGDDDRSYAYSVSDFSEVEPHESRSRAASFAAYGDEAEQEEDDDDERMDDVDARSDATFNTALSQGWTSSLGGGGVAAASMSEGDGGWTSGGLPAEESEGSGEILPGPVRSAVGEGDGRERVKVYEVAEGISGEKEKEVEEAWGKGRVVFLPLPSTSSSSAQKPSTSLLPLALHPSALPLLPLVRPSTALLTSLSSDRGKRQAELDTAHLPTPPASPPTFRQDGLELPSFASSHFTADGTTESTLSKEELEKALQEQLERGLGRWVIARHSQD